MLVLNALNIQLHQAVQRGGSAASRVAEEGETMLQEGGEGVESKTPCVAHINTYWDHHNGQGAEFPVLRAAVLCQLTNLQWKSTRADV